MHSTLTESLDVLLGAGADTGAPSPIEAGTGAPPLQHTGAGAPPLQHTGAGAPSPTWAGTGAPPLQDTGTGAPSATGAGTGAPPLQHTGAEAPALQHLIAPAAVLELKKLAANLAPILRGGFECRLADSAPQVDLQQCVVPDESELTLLRDHIAAVTCAGGVSAHPGWSQLQDFLAEWCEPLSPLHNSIPEIWLEFDINSPSVLLPLPAIFFGLPQEVSPAVEPYPIGVAHLWDGEPHPPTPSPHAGRGSKREFSMSGKSFNHPSTVQRHPIAAKALDLLLGESGWCDWQDNLYRCFAACPDGVFVSHIGVMLSRKAPALRVNVKRLLPDSLVPYLQQIGWEGETAEVGSLMRQLLAFADRITVCLDVGKRIYPQIGLECILLKQPQSEPRWTAFVNYLVEGGLCAPAKVEALLNWPGQTNPASAPAPWPGQLIAASLLQPQNCFSVFERRLSHIKIVWQPQRRLEAKAYLWFQHQWLSVERKR